MECPYWPYNYIIWCGYNSLVNRALELLKNPVPTALKQVYITKKTGLPQIRLTRPMDIHQLVPGKRAPCVFCRWSRQNKRGVSHITKTNCVPRTQYSCSHCSTPLCGPCFWLFHFTVA